MVSPSPTVFIFESSCHETWSHDQAWLSIFMIRPVISSFYATTILQQGNVYPQLLLHIIVTPWLVWSCNCNSRNSSYTVMVTKINQTPSWTFTLAGQRYHFSNNLPYTHKHICMCVISTKMCRFVDCQKQKPKKFYKELW